MATIRLVIGVLLGGVVLWLFVVFTNVTARRLRDKLEAGLQTVKNPGQERRRFDRSRECRRLAVAIGMAGCIMMLQRLMSTSAFGAISFIGYLGLFPATYFIGREDGKKIGRVGVAQAFGVIVGLLATATVTYFVGR